MSKISFQLALHSVRRSRNVFHVASALALVLTILSITLVIINDGIGDHRHEEAAADYGRAVSIGVRKDATFPDSNPLAMFGVFVGMCPISTSNWHVKMGWIYIPKTKPLSMVVEAPYVYFTIPGDATNIRPGQLNALNMESGDSVEGIGEYSTIKIAKRVPDHVGVISHPSKYFEYPQGVYRMYYSVEFDTRQWSRYRYGLGHDSFKLSYAPEVAIRDGYQDGLGDALDKLPEASRVVDFSLCGSSDRQGLEVVDGSLDPLPAMPAPKGEKIWASPINKPFAIAGEVEGGFWFSLGQAAPAVASNSAFALLGAIYGLGIQAPDPKRASRERSGASNVLPRQGNVNRSKGSVASNRRPRSSRRRRRPRSR